MLPAQALSELLAAVEEGGGDATFRFDNIQHWGESVRALFVDCKLIKKAPLASVLRCQGCEEGCLSDVVVGNFGAGKSKPYIICQVSEKQAEMGRVPVNPERLQCWQCSMESLAEVLQIGLELGPGNRARTNDGSIQLGMLQGPHGRRWATLRASPLVLEVNQSQLAVSELLFVDSGTIQVDLPRIQHLLSSQKLAIEKPYQSNTQRREARKHATTAMYQDWCDEYLRLKKQKPGHSKSWYAVQIARMPIACERDSETIRKRLP